MSVDWMAVLVVAVVSVAATALIALLLAAGIRLLLPGRGATRPAQTSVVSRTMGWALLGVTGVVILAGLWLLVPHAR
jgi:ribosomal protein S3